MNIKFHTIIRDITGQTGLAVINAIINGERNPQNFIPLIDYRVKADEQTILKSLEGTWREEHLFTLKSSYDMFIKFRLEIGYCETEIEKHLQTMEAKANEGEVVKKKKLMK
jgi:transposase